MAVEPVASDHVGKPDPNRRELSISGEDLRRLASSAGIQFETQTEAVATLLWREGKADRHASILAGPVQGGKTGCALLVTDIDVKRGMSNPIGLKVKDWVCNPLTSIHLESGPYLTELKTHSLQIRAGELHQGYGQIDLELVATGGSRLQRVAFIQNAVEPGAAVVQRIASQTGKTGTALVITLTTGRSVGLKWDGTRYVRQDDERGRIAEVKVDDN